MFEGFRLPARRESKTEKFILALGSQALLLLGEINVLTPDRNIYDSNLQDLMCQSKQDEKIYI